MADPQGSGLKRFMAADLCHQDPQTQDTARGDTNSPISPSYRPKLRPYRAGKFSPIGPFGDSQPWPSQQGCHHHRTAQGGPGARITTAGACPTFGELMCLPTQSRPRRMGGGRNPHRAVPILRARAVGGRLLMGARTCAPSFKKSRNFDLFTPETRSQRSGARCLHRWFQRQVQTAHRIDLAMPGTSANDCGFP